jgi:hypothetical protein
MAYRPRSWASSDQILGAAVIVGDAELRWPRKLGRVMVIKTGHGVFGLPRRFAPRDDGAKHRDQSS